MSACSKEAVDDNIEVYSQGEIEDKEIVIENNDLNFTFSLKLLSFMY